MSKTVAEQIAANVAASKQLTQEQEIALLRAENQALRDNKKVSYTFKVSTKGALSVYGMGRFPITLYKEQWIKLLGMAKGLLEFIAANDDLLKSKETPAAKVQA